MSLIASLSFATVALPTDAPAQSAHAQVSARSQMSVFKGKQLSPKQCHASTNEKAFRTCTFGSATPTHRIALTGDSHAMQYQKPILALAQKYGWSVTFVLKSACPLFDVALLPANMDNPTCLWWSSRRETYFANQQPFDLVINSNSTIITRYKKNMAASFALAVKKFTNRKSTFLLISDSPKAIDGVETCAKSETKLFSGRCDNTRKAALSISDILPAAVAKNKRVIVADFTDAYCDKSTCYAYRFAEKVYRDRGHITLDWAMHLLSRLDAVIPAELKLQK